MSEAELHFLKARMRGGALNKARRGELKMGLPVGFLYNERDEVMLDPDRQVQAAIRCLFETFRRTGSACATVKAFRKQELLFPRRVWRGFRKGELYWVPLTLDRALKVLHNPRYAGAFFYGRTHHRKRADGRLQTTKQPREQWFALLPDAHEGYITWQEFEENERRLKENAQAYGADRRMRTPGEGPALLQGLAICGRCGRRMTVRYHTRGGRSIPDYWCAREGIAHGHSFCHRVPGECVDEAIAKLIIEALTPISLEVALSVQAELLARAEQADRLRAQQVERARYEAELARRRYLNVAPENRLVADALEADWNERLRALEEAQRIYEQQRAQDRLLVDDQLRSEILSLASDFSRLWACPQTGHRERKRMVRLILEDVTLHKGDVITLAVRFRGGATRRLTLSRPKNAPERRRTAPEVIEAIDRLLEDHMASEIAQILNERGLRSGEGLPFTRERVDRLRCEYRLKSRYDRLRERGLLTLQEMGEILQVNTTTLRLWHKHGVIKGYVFNGRNECLYEPPGDTPPQKIPGKPLLNRLPTSEAPLQSNP